MVVVAQATVRVGRCRHFTDPVERDLGGIFSFPNTLGTQHFPISAFDALSERLCPTADSLVKVYAEPADAEH